MPYDLYQRCPGSYMPHNTINNKIYKYCLYIIDIVLKFKWTISLINKIASSVAKAFKKVYNNPKCSLI